MATKKPTTETQEEYRQRVVDIYVLKDPTTNEVRYIGKANDAAKRLLSHIRDSRRRDTPVYRWFRKLAENNLIPIIEVIETCTVEMWPEVEIRLIAEYKKTSRLLNVALGGDEPYCSTDQRAINGRNVARSVHGDPLKKKIWSIKKYFGQELARLKKAGDIDCHNKMVRKLRGDDDVRMKEIGWFSHLQEII